MIEKLIRATIPMCTCGAEVVPRKNVLMGTICDCSQCGRETDRPCYGYRAPDVSGVAAKLRGYAEDMRRFGLSCLMPKAAAEDFDEMAGFLEGKE